MMYCYFINGPFKVFSIFFFHFCQVMQIRVHNTPTIHLTCTLYYPFLLTNGVFVHSIAYEPNQSTFLRHSNY